MSSRPFKCPLVIAAALALCGVARAATTELIQNGSFEEPNIPAATFQQVDSIPGWTGTAGVEVQSNGVLAGGGTPFGSQYAELNVEEGSTYSQTVDTVTGEEYTLSFYLAARPGAGDTSVRVSFAGQEPQVFTVEESTAVSFEQFTMSVTATGGDSVLTFAPTESAVNGQGDLLDNVSLTSLTGGGGNGGPNPIPLPPGVWAGLGTLFAMTAPRALRRWRRSH